MTDAPQVPLKRGRLFDVPAVSGSQERFDELLRGESFRLERIVSTGQSTPSGQWYDQPEEEWVVLLSGSATLRFVEPAETIDLIPGDWLLIPAHRRHRVERTAAEETTVWLALHATGASCSVRDTTIEVK